MEIAKKKNAMKRCVNCGIQMYQLTTVDDLPPAQRAVLDSWIAPVQAPPGEPLCGRCLALALATGPGGERRLGHEWACPSCGRSMRSRASGGPLPPPGTDGHRLLLQWVGDLRGLCTSYCHSCRTRIRHEEANLAAAARAQAEAAARDEGEGEAEEAEEQEPSSLLPLEGWRRVAGAAGACAVARCPRPPSGAPLRLRRRLARELRLYAPPTRPRLCARHHRLLPEQRDAVAYSGEFSGEDVADLLLLLGEARPLDFGAVAALDEPACRWALGVGKERFAELLAGAGGVPPRALALALAQRRSGDCPAVLASRAQLPRDTVVAELAAAEAFLARVPEAVAPDDAPDGNLNGL